MCARRYSLCFEILQWVSAREECFWTYSIKEQSLERPWMVLQTFKNNAIKVKIEALIIEQSISHSLITDKTSIEKFYNTLVLKKLIFFWSIFNRPLA